MQAQRKQAELDRFNIIHNHSESSQSLSHRYPKKKEQKFKIAKVYKEKEYDDESPRRKYNYDF